MARRRYTNDQKAALLADFGRRAITAAENAF
jgi:hypothetical protein